ncbi:MAG: response regulator [Pseudomonadota bacterium]
MTFLGVRWRLFRAAEPKRGWKEAALLTGIFLLAVYLGAIWSRTEENSTAFWAANGVLAAGLLLLRPRVALAFAVLCTAINVVMNIFGELPTILNIAFTSLNVALSLTVAVLVRTFCGAAMDLGRLRRFIPFLLIVGGATLVEGLIGALAVPREAERILTIWQRWSACDAVGMVLALPATLMFMRRVNPLYAGPASRTERIALLAAVGLGGYLSFGVAAAPVFLLLYPAVLFAAFRLGSAWAFVAVWIIAQAATIQTLANRGPIAVFDGPPPFLELGLLQVFLVSLLLTASLATSAMAERVRAEQRLRRKAAATAAARARADQISATRERFLAVVGHEIRTPLNGILGFGETLARRGDLPADVRHQIEMIGRSTEALMEIVDDILDFSRIESGQLQLAPAPTAVGDAIERAVAAARPRAGDKGVAVSLTGDAFGRDLHAVDPRRLNQLLGHLLGNAVKFTEAGEILVEVTREPRAGGAAERVTVAITDTGSGVAERLRRDLFKPFSQLDPSLSRKHGGAGLGLSICRAIVELMGGDIGYRPRRGGGSCFWFSLNLARAGTAPEAEEDLGERPPRILVVDDHPMNREVARLFLDAFGCEVAEAADGAEAVEAVRAGPFDAVLMDLRMPGVDGLAATRMIRAMGGPVSEVPILAVTADVMREDIERCRDAGMNGHIPKPISQARLLNALTCALQGRDAFPGDLAA